MAAKNVLFLQKLFLTFDSQTSLKCMNAFTFHFHQPPQPSALVLLLELHQKAKKDAPQAHLHLLTGQLGSRA